MMADNCTKYWTASALALTLASVLCPGDLAAASDPVLPDLTSLSLEELMTIEVTSPSKRAEPLGDTPAAIFVLTRDDIRRSGARTIPDVLRLVPGVEVAQVNGHTYAVSARGFNSRFANKLLVLMDGRSVYTPLFSGVFWDRQDTLLEDVDRIEVIRGPGASLWGANAVNGVINIITRPASETQGTYVELGGGLRETAFGAVRQGVDLSDDVYLRAFGKVDYRDEQQTPAGEDGGDSFRAAQAGFRLDAARGVDDFQLHGGAFRTRATEEFDEPTLTAPFTVERDTSFNATGGYLLGRWDRQLDSDASVALQSYLDYETFEDVRLSSDRLTWDIEFQHDFQAEERHRMVWGLGARTTYDQFDGDFAVDLDPDNDLSYLLSGFIQDTFSIVPDELDLTIGSKVELNSYTGLEVQPNARLLWHADERHTFWGAVSRAVRTPSRAERDVRLNNAVIPPSAPGGLPTVVSLFGDHGVVSEKMMAYEAGYRLQAHRQLSFDLAVFYNQYKDLLTATQGVPYLDTSLGQPAVVAPLTAASLLEGRAYGFELVTNVQPATNWRLQIGYAYTEIDLEPVPGPTDLTSGIEGASPHHSASVVSYVDVSDTLTFDTTARYVDDLPSLGVPSYLTFDARVAWQPHPGVELAVVGRNLAGSHLEFSSESILAGSTTEVEPSLFATLRLSF